MANKDCFYCCKTCKETQTVLENIFQVLNIYNWLLDAYVVDFFYEDLWSKLPMSWQTTLNKLSPQELGCWFLGEKSCVGTVLPLSLIALREATKILQINRNDNEQVIFKCDKESNQKDSYTTDDKSETQVIQNLTGNDKKNNLLLKHVKIKKRYEVEKIAQILSNLSVKTNSTRVVDVGAGIGHLSRVLAVKYDLQVIRVEQDEVLLDCARLQDQQLVTSMQKHDSNFNFKKPYHLTLKINASNVQSEFVEKMPDDIGIKNGFGIVGLHPCGDLAINLLRLYISSDEAKFVCLVGCCYMKLSTSDGCNAMKGYPLSNFLSKMSNNYLSYNALEVACHANEKHFDKLKLGDYDDLKIHTYRAVLELLLAEMDINYRHSQLKSVKLKNDFSFQQYLNLALESRDIRNLPTSDILQSPKVLKMLDRWKEVLIFGSLRLMLAPLVETAILLDRFLYLSENNLQPSLKAEFDCRISPRNFVLISYKT